MERTAAYPTQSRRMYKGTATPNCRRFGMTDSFVPFQPNTSVAAGRDDAILYGAVERDPGGLPRGTIEHITLSDFFNVAGETFQATVHLRSGRGTLRRGSVELEAPAGWTVEPRQYVGPVSSRRERKVTFDVTASGSAAVNSNFRISALYGTGSKTGYTSKVVRIGPPVEGRFERWGKWEEYDKNWLTGTAPRALRIGCSAAVQSIDIGETITLPVDVHNWSAVAQSGAVELELPANFTGDAASKPYRDTRTGRAGDGRVRAHEHRSDAVPANQVATIPVETSYSHRRARAGRTWRSRSLRRPRSRRRPLRRSSTAARGRASTAGPPSTSASAGRRRTATRRASTAAQARTRQVTRHGDDLYFFVHVRDDFQSYAVKPAECVAHWFADSVEITTDLRGTASQTNMDTASTFKLGVFVFPYTDDPSNVNGNGNGVNGPCWTSNLSARRHADLH